MEELWYKADLSNTTVSGYMDRIKERRYFLFQSINQILNGQSLGIRADVLAYIADNIDNFMDDKDYALHISSLVGNADIGPEWYEWINSFSKSDNPIGVGDFMIFLTDAIEKEIPLRNVKQMFESGDDDILKIYEKMDKYVQLLDAGSDNSSDDAEGQEGPVPTQSVDTVEKNEETQIVTGREPAFAEMFEDLATIMGSNTRGDDDALKMQDDFNKALTSIQTLAIEIFREWGKDKDTIARMNALHNVYQRLLNGQQTKINEMRNEITRLRHQIREAERTAMKHEAINQKILELQELSYASGSVLPDYNVY